MVHGLPWTGRIDHGFYNFRPTLFFDIAAANGYTLHTVCHAVTSPFELESPNSRDAFAALVKAGRIAPNTMLYGVFSKAAAEALASAAQCL